MKLFYLSALTLVLCVTTVLSSSPSKLPFTSKQSVVLASSENHPFAPVPVVKNGALASLPTLSAQSVLAVDLDSGVSLYEKEPDKKILPASTTKIITALVALDSYPLDQVITVGNVAVEGQKMKLVKGEQITVNNLLYGLLVYSANDAAEVLAAAYPGGRAGFVAAMNKKAAELHMDSSSFTNPAGLDDPNHYSTARDLVRAAWVAMQDKRFAQMVGTKSITVTSVDGKIQHPLTNINELLGTVDGVRGVKTGWTEAARENLVTYIVRNDHKVLIAVTGSEDRFGETKKMIDWIFNSYSWQEVKLPG
ncbi:MAG: D-alanyl-D-alanine carboxypeptidase family protein [Candidatus Microgenomates bacterium]|jgi:D-alanyl-D-alanine carboxypeptidase